MELSINEKREIIDNVQHRIDKWIGRSHMTMHEAILLAGDIILLRFISIRRFLVL